MVWDDRYPRFGVQVTPAGTITFKCTYYHKGRLRWISLDQYPAIGLKHAREIAQTIQAKAALARVQRVEEEVLEELSGDIDRRQLKIDVLKTELMNKPITRQRLEQLQLQRHRGVQIYVISDGIFCKVGVSSNSLRRCKGLQTANSENLSLVFTTEFFQRAIAYSIEKLIHTSLRKKFISCGEWFKSEPDEIIIVIQHHLRVLNG